MCIENCYICLFFNGEYINWRIIVFLVLKIMMRKMMIVFNVNIYCWFFVLVGIDWELFFFNFSWELDR